MGLTASLNIGRTALSASQIAIQVTGNNVANASTPGYSRQSVHLGAIPDQFFNPYYIGRGVSVQGISRQVDNGLLARLNTAVSDESSANVDQSLLTAIESAVNALGDHDLSAQFNEFFNAWSTLANSPNQDGARALVVQQGRTLAASIRTLRSDLAKFSRQIDAQMAPAVDKANSLLTQIANANAQITNAEGGGPGEASSLRDHRDQLVNELSKLMDISVVEQGNGTQTILSGSTPLVVNGASRGIKMVSTVTNGVTDVTINVLDDSTQLTVSSGTIGGYLRNRTGAAQSTIDTLDQVSSQLIFEVNRIHSQGVGTVRLTSSTGTLEMSGAETALALNDPTNFTLASLPFHPTTGGFLVTVTNNQTGSSQTVRVNVDLDGIQNDGSPGYGDDTSLASLAAQLGGIGNLSATIRTNGTLQVDAAAGFTLSFSEDSSGVLAVLGLNTYFTGKDARDIDVRQELQTNPSLLATGSIVAGEPVHNGAALNIAGLRTKNLASLGDRSLTQTWTDAAAGIGVQAGAAASKAQAASTVRQALDSQRQAVSGVDLDEETINLMNYQRQYQGAARFISVIDELTQTLLSMIGSVA